ncbi:hypothetical protein EGT49_04300 [Companilactobacillus suantsaicola]|uniref:Uncharacterized protein n=1 Tax=Companilactobacillus suantsaicola TaxID=2487723 RepID=A0A4Z0JLH6_9LACO|nr:hypothetical protein EGT49_04300 [Companilactobacillus suantsaicola]
MILFVRRWLDAVFRNSSGHNLEPIPKAGIVFKIGLPLGAESAKRNFRAEHFPELLLQTGFQIFAIISVNSERDMVLFSVIVR